MKNAMILVIMIGYFGIASAKDMYIGLFSSVVHLSKNDTLNVRKSPDYHSEKIGALPIDAYVGVDICRDVGGSTWCKVHHVAQHDYEDFPYDASAGWVNARYLKFINHGYVIIHDNPNCDYALKCQENKCEVVSDYTIDDEANIVSLKTNL